MRRIYLFLVILTITLAAFFTLAIVSWYLAASSPAYYGSSWMKRMWNGVSTTSGNGMGGMMGNGGATTSASYYWLIPVALGAVIAVAVIGVAFYLAFPELNYIKGNTTCNPNLANKGVETQLFNSAAETNNSLPPNLNTAKTASNCEVLLKTMNPEEQKVLNVLFAHNGKYLQKYVVRETGLSRLKTHRIVARFAERGIVTVQEFGNTNEIMVSNWVKN